MRILLTLIGSLLLITGVQAQTKDTIKLTLQQVDSLFLTNNFQLLVSRYQVRSDSALIKQARLWDNPEFTAEFGMNSWSHPKLSVGNQGQTAYSIDQVIKLAGQRNKNIALATLNADYSEASFEELMRTLKWELHKAFTEYYFQNRTIKVLKEQQLVLDRIVLAYSKADSSGSVAHADYIRLAQLQMSLKNDYLTALSRLMDQQQTLQQLLGTTLPVNPIMEAKQYSVPVLSEISLEQLIGQALKDRPEIRLSGIDQKTAAINYSLQKALAVPNMHVGAIYDKNSGVVHNYMGLTMGVEIPFWNRNQGNIRRAKFQIAQSAIKWQQTQNVITTQVISAFNKFQQYREAFTPGALSAFQDSFSILIEKVAQNFTKGNVTLLQFIDFFNSYSDNFNDQNGYYSALYDALNDLEYAVGAPFINH